ncbi:cupin-like domain-containing protein [Pseudoalteromonas rubra]|uniref:JmjC domain-containing protein n=1 Tax=Pseudoalteromonas rubra TaxID=43658 RepID=A0A0F4QUP6_9GAMM|nr:cupin-like domain-containing protein [Pseudoalteromonas rubra]KJZ11426.1 hypothetical protein TW77_05985 [Pseudoalteromonas rubra]
MNCVSTVESLSRYDFVTKYKNNQPVLVKGGAINFPAVAKWDSLYLKSKYGHAQVLPNRYLNCPNDYDKTKPESLSLREFLDLLDNKTKNYNCYMFNRAESGNFWSNKHKVGAIVNPQLTRLKEDFPHFDFLYEDDYIYQQIIIGSHLNATKLHYDWGGEGKVLTQIRGSKTIYLVSPKYSNLVPLPPITDSTNLSAANIPVSQLQTEHPNIEIYKVVLEAGDFIYWPAFWFHEIQNIGDLNIAVATPVDEIKYSALLKRQILSAIYNRFEQDTELSIKRSKLNESFNSIERSTLSQSNLQNLWDWNQALPPR